MLCKMEFKRSLLFVIFVAIQQFQPIDSARILGFFSTPSRSHLIIHESLMRELASRGHDVTVITTFKQIGKPIPNYRYIEVTVPEDPEFKKAQEHMLKGAEKGEHFLKHFSTLVKATTGQTSKILKSTAMDEIKKEKFDLVVFGQFINDFQIGLAHHFNCPSVIITVFPAVKSVRDFVGNPDEFSSVPHLFIGANDRMTFTQRFLNVLISGMEMALSSGMEYFLMEPLYREHFPLETFPSYWDMRKNVSLILVNQHFSQGTPQALVPALQEFSGMHIKRKPDPLPENIQQWLDSATDGVIYFSMGSNTKSSDLSLDKRQAILRTFATLKQKVLWKFEDDLPDKPKNVMISKWLPQDDVLAHANVVLFISHCGKGGLSEAKYHGVPVLGIPILADQPSNLKIAVKEGWAVGLQYADLNEKTFSDALHEALSNRTYGDVVRRHSLKFRDRPQHPLDNAAFWVEYVIRHHGAKHLQSPGAHLNFFQFYSLDVFAALLLIFYITVKVSKCFLKFLYRKICGGSSSDSKTKPNSKNDKKRQ
ncbi:UDP-glucosyltransferase 2-like [Bradysia coprophila]|uniref:UDP-glucosyltransferase 2-like n=1 Tax=Bradysia coprophila TaxID=38358 RepID=UPI00187D960D|nr:UDP-glucosyltransferase 2-like [Bradysia coprophila]